MHLRCSSGVRRPPGAGFARAADAPPSPGLEGVEELASVAGILPRRASIGRPPVRDNIVRLLDPDRLL